MEKNMTAQHTPGPWNCERFEDGQNKYCQLANVVAPNFGTICELRYSDSTYLGDTKADERKATQLANASLIAAAPDMLTALEALVEQAEDAQSHIGGRGLASLWIEMEKARAAIAKAKGGAK